MSGQITPDSREGENVANEICSKRIEGQIKEMQEEGEKRKMEV